MLALRSLAFAASGEPTSAGRVDWLRVQEAFGAFVDYPSSENAKSVRLLLPHKHVEYDDSDAGQAALETIYDGLPMLERQVEARDPEAVRLAFDLYAVADGAAREELDIMLGQLMRIDPRLFLQVLKPRVRRFAALDGLVGDLGDPYLDRTRAQCLELQLRIASLERIPDRALSGVREGCMAELRKQVRARCH